ncbi:50S ribosomal protein L11 methyltransferase [Roseitranquillus sediminis]|uniref:50S ribosomal protein L11 methyltransferase n=1 Tax=Roseitranquillus sediminis TaxID=2809051 RepID=UPI001D0C34B2|nr:50S ribosomal protein L11 methyltransferase [Roseitranquillus sediminis]MBM9596404.1 50S ribosomal protein L11 methyltransferase [Roseitranquillus sediminis]
MTTYTALTTLSGEAQARALAEAMERLDPEPTGVGVFEIEDGSGLWEVGGYFEAPPDEAALALLAVATGARPFAVSELPETDWVAKVRRDLAPVEAGRFFVHGSHDADRVPEGRIALLIEAAMAFGTGHHGTTLGCLRALNRLADGPAPRAIADIGCGTALLAMAAARVWRVPVVASDIDPVAVEVARANVAANGLQGRVTCVEASGTSDSQIAAAAPYDLVFANILMAPLVALAPDLAQVVAPGGRVILSGLLVEQGAPAAEAYRAQGFEDEAREDIGEWTTLTMRRRA